MRLDTLLGSRGEPLAEIGDETINSSVAWLEALPASQRQALASEYARAFGGAARQALDTVLKSRTSRLEDYCAISRRYPMTPAAGAALAAAGDQAMLLGDFAAARALYELAQHQNLPLNPASARNLQAARQFMAARIPAPSDLDDKSSAATNDHPPLQGSIPFDAPWYGDASLAGHTRLFPAIYNGHVILSTWKEVLMARDDGTARWTSPNPTPPGAFQGDRTNNRSRGALFAPAVLRDVHGRASIIVVCQPVTQAPSQFVLRALRASDGKILWSSPADPRNNSTYAGLPAIAGRYVYAIHVAKTGPASANLALHALDITTGQAIWQTTLGAISEQGDLHGGKFARPLPIDLDAFASLSEPAIDGDLVIISPNCGWLIAVGRFDGRIRWLHSYRKDEVPNAKPRGARRNDEGEPDRKKTLLARYHSTPVVCGQVVLTMPQDNASLVAVDRASGRALWETDTIEGYGLAGGRDNIAVVTGPALCGIDATTGKLKWRYTPPRRANLTGPPVIIDQTLIAPITTGYIQLNIADGVEKPTHEIPNFRRLLFTESLKTAIRDSGATKAFNVK